MTIERPDLSQVDPDIRIYIESLEAKIAQLQKKPHARQRSVPKEIDEPSEPPTSACVVTMSKSGLIKRTYRHLYIRQRRGGMGIFDIETSEQDPPIYLTLADEENDLLVVTDFGRCYRFPVSSLPPAQVRDRGQEISSILDFQSDESIRLILPASDEGFLALLSERGYVRLLRHHYMGEKMRPGTPIFDSGRFGPVSAGCWTTGDDDLFIATRSGKAIRFREKMVHANGSLGIRLDRGDDVAAITGTTSDGGILLIGADGKGTIRLMSGFSANKAPGSGGKIAMKTDHLAGVSSIKDNDDIFVLSRLSKIIRFQATEIPPKTGVVQGVNCMSLRADEVTAITVSAHP